MGNYTPPSGRTRSTLTLTWLWIAFSVYTGAAFAFLLFSFGTTLFSSSLIGRLFYSYDVGLALLLGLLSLLAVLSSWCIALLIKGRRWALYPYLGFTVCAIPLAYISDYSTNIYFAIAVLVLFLLTWLSLFCRYKGQSAWSVMDNAFDWAHCRHLNLTYLIAFVIFAAVVVGAVIQAPTHAKDDSFLSAYDDEESLYDEEAVDSAAVDDATSDAFTAEDLVQQANTEMPMDLGSGLIVTRVDLWDNYLVYIVDVDEDEMSIEALQDNSIAMKELIRSSFDSGDDPFVSLLQELDMGMGYCYVGSMSRDTAFVSFSPEEVAGF